MDIIVQMKHNTVTQESDMLETILLKIKKSFFRQTMVLCAIFTLVGVMTGCGSDGSTSDDSTSDGSTPAKYFRYVKKGNVKDGEYIVIKGLNTACDENGKLKVNLNDIWEKYNGRIVIPSKIEGLPVRSVKITELGGPLGDGDKLPNGLYLLDLLDAEKMLYASDEKYNELITEVVIPEVDTLKKVDIFEWGEIKLTMPLSLFTSDKFSFNTRSRDVVIVQGNSTASEFINDDCIRAALEGKLTLPECVTKINIGNGIRFLDELNCSPNAVFAFRGEVYTNNVKDLMRKINRETGIRNIDVINGEKMPE